MAKSTTIYLLVVLLFTGAFILAAMRPLDNIIGILCVAGTLLFLWRIARGDD